MVILLVAWTTAALFVAAFAAGMFILHPTRENGRRVAATAGLTVAMLAASWLWFHV